MKPALFVQLLVILAFAVAAHAQGADSPKPKPTSAKPDAAVAAEYKRLLELQTKLEAITPERSGREPHKSFLKKHESEIVYSEPSATWLVRSELFWALADKNRELPVADEIAYTASMNPLPGECEGYVNCYLYSLKATSGRYLTIFPAGGRSEVLLNDMAELLGTVVDPESRDQYTWPTEAEEEAELLKTITELQNILAKVPSKTKEPVVDKLRRLTDANK